FFFSSRRRHTRCYRDWSSDVCSSDLLHPGASTTIRIEPPSGFFELRLGEVWAYRELLYFFVWRDVKIRYKQTAIGVLWVVLQPEIGRASCRERVYIEVAGESTKKIT